ncbi:MAG: hypothetical protein SH809_03430 [Rhodothermales bacterium]|nr:hypothetical protein [Rhodothermales bacterium]
MPEEIFIIIVVSILAGTFSGIVKMVLEFMKMRQGTLPSGSAADSMTASELERLLEKAVRQGTTKLSERLEAIEERLEIPPQKTPRLNAGRLDLPADDPLPAEDALPATRKRSRA